MRIFRMLVALGLLAVGSCLPVCAQPPAPGGCPPVPSSTPTCDDKKWAQSFTTYLWVPGINGDMTVNGTTIPIDTSVSDTWSSLINNREGAFTGHYEATKDRGTAFVDVMYIHLQQDTEFNGAPIEVEPEQTVAEFGAGYALQRYAACQNTPYRTELIGGARYNHVNMGVTDLTSGVSAGTSQSWVDPFFGLRTRYPLSRYWAAMARADIGGFGIGHSSKFTWNAFVGLAYFSSAQWSFEPGWRWLAYNYESHDGTVDFDVTYSGPFLGFSYHY